jgi:hypothetical protein
MYGSQETLVTKEKAVIYFLHEEILTIFQILRKIFIDGGKKITSRIIRGLMDK